MTTIRRIRTLGLLALAGLAPRLAAAAEGAPSAAGGAGVIVGQVQHASVKRSPTLVYLAAVPGDYKPPEKGVVLKQSGKAFVPGVLPVLAGTTVVFTNEDSFNHNVFTPDFPPKQKAKAGAKYYDLGTWGQGEKRTFKFEQPGVYTQLCTIHPEMAGTVVVLQNPYFALADKEGKFRIGGVPPGEWKLKVWNDRLRPQQAEKAHGVKVDAGGEAHVTLQP